MLGNISKAQWDKERHGEDEAKLFVRDHGVDNEKRQRCPCQPGFGVLDPAVEKSRYVEETDWRDSSRKPFGNVSVPRIDAKAGSKALKDVDVKIIPRGEGPFSIAPKIERNGEKPTNNDPERDFEKSHPALFAKKWQPEDGKEDHD